MDDNFTGTVSVLEMVTQISGRESELGLIGACLKDNMAFNDVKDIVSPSDFSWHCYGWVWDAMQKLNDNGMGIDQITVGDELNRAGKLSEFATEGGQFRGRTALSRIRDEGIPENVETYANKVADYAAKRKIFTWSSEWAGWAANGRTSSEIAQDITKQLGTLRTFGGGVTKHTQSLADAVSTAYDKTYQAATTGISFVKTGIIDLDNLLGGGLTAPDLVILGGRPGKGKTALLATIAKNAAEDGKRIVIFTLEMQSHQIAMRLIAMISGIPYDRQKSGKLQEHEWPLYTNAVDALADKSRYDIILNDMPAISVSGIRQELRRIGKVDLVIVDYLQLQSADGKHQNRTGEVSEISRGLKVLTKEFDVPILAAAQLNRETEKRGDGRPILSDLKESGSIEQDADTVIFIHTPDDSVGITNLIVAKQRNGPTGTVNTVYRSNLTKFENCQAKHVDFGEY